MSLLRANKSTRDYPLRLPISWVFMCFLLFSILVLSIGLGTVMVIKMDDLIKNDREQLIRQQMTSLGQEISHYIHLRNIVLQDYAAFPVLLQGVMQPSSGLANASDFIDDLSLLGEKTPIHLLDLDGEPIYSTNPKSKCLSKQHIFAPIFHQQTQDVIRMGFCKEKSANEDFWVLVTPIKYHGQTEGYLSAELSNTRLIEGTSLKQYEKAHQINVLKNESLLFSFGTSNLNSAAEEIKTDNLGMVLRYKSDEHALSQVRKSVIVNLIISILPILLGILVLSQKLGYAYLVRPLEQLRTMTKKLANGDKISFDRKQERVWEVYELQYHFHQMANQIEHREQALKDANEALHQLHEKTIHQQQMLVHSEKLASVGQLAAGVAHEINNPTGFVRGNLETQRKYINDLNSILLAYAQLENDLTQLDPQRPSLHAIAELKSKIDLDYILEDLTDLTEESLDGATRIQNIVQDLKSFSRIDNQGNQVVDLNQEVIETSLRLVSSEIKYKCDIKKDLEPLPAIACKPGEISQVIMNLLINACDAIEETGTICIASYASENSVYVDVSDTGAGISDEELLKLFDPFYTTKDIGKGTGLGLSICQAIIQRHGGEIHVRSNIGVGTTFTICLPITTQESE